MDIRNLTLKQRQEFCEKTAGIELTHTKSSFPDLEKEVQGNCEQVIGVDKSAAGDCRATANYFSDWSLLGISAFSNYRRGLGCQR
jgi:hypothetical protein